MRLTRRKSKALGRTDPPVPTSLEHPHLWGRTDLERSFSAVYVRLHAPLHAYAERFLDRDSARDAVADATVKLWKRWGDLTEEQRTDRYFFRAVHNAVLTIKHRGANKLSLEDGEDELDVRAEKEFVVETGRDATYAVLDAAIAALPPRRREALLLVKEQSYSFAEAAEILGLRLDTIGTHVRLGLAQLRDAFRRAGFTIEDRRRAPSRSLEGGDTND